MTDSSGGFFSDLSSLGNDIWGGISSAGSWAGNQLSNIGTSIESLFGGSPTPTGTAPQVSTGQAAAALSPSPSLGDFGGMSFAPGQTPLSSTNSAYGGSTPVSPQMLSDASAQNQQPTGDSGQSWLGQAGSVLKDLSGGKSTNPLGVLASTGGLAYNLLEGSPTTSAEKQLKNIAGQQNAQGQQLQSYLANGTLPPGAQAWVNQQTSGQKAAIQSKYAQLGMSGSTAEMQELNQVDAQATSQMFTIASSLLNTGIQETGASGTLYKYLMDAQNADSKDMSSAIQNFVAALSGGSGGGGQNLTLSLAKP